MNKSSYGYFQKRRIRWLDDRLRRVHEIFEFGIKYIENSKTLQKLDESTETAQMQFSASSRDSFTECCG